VAVLVVAYMVSSSAIWVNELWFSDRFRFAIFLFDPPRFFSLANGSLTGSCVLGDAT
jgi:hypothetical protein